MVFVNYEVGSVASVGMDCENLKKDRSSVLRAESCSNHGVVSKTTWLSCMLALLWIVV